MKNRLYIIILAFFTILMCNPEIAEAKTYSVHMHNYLRGFHAHIKSSPMSRHVRSFRLIKVSYKSNKAHRYKFAAYKPIRIHHIKF